MKPGRELDELVAEKVMGWYRNPTSGQVYESIDNYIVPSYSRSIAAAWEIFEKFTRFASSPSISGGMSFETKEIFYQARIEDHLAYGDSGPHAICLAALKVVGFEI